MGTMRMVRIAELWPSRWQPREAFDAEALMELALSIQELGLINPVVVFKRDDGEWELVAGERRARAVAALALAELHHDLEWWIDILARHGLQEPMTWAKLADCKAEIMARVEDSDPQRLHMIAAMENIERQNLTPLEEARALAGLLEDTGWTQTELAERLGRTHGWVSQRLGLLGLPRVAQRALQAGRLTVSHGRAIGSVPKAVREEFAAWVVQGSGAEPVGARRAEEMAAGVRRILDAEFWRPSPGTVYKPGVLNRLRMMAWLVVNRPADVRGLLAQMATVGEGVDAEALADSWRIRSVLQYGWGMTLEAAWAEFAAATERDCTHCQWRERSEAAQRIVDCKLADGQGKRWTCPSYCGDEEPVVVPVSDMLWGKGAAEDRADGPWGRYLTSAEALEAALAGSGEPKDPEETELERRRGWWQFLWDWQARAGEGGHFFSHRCEDCALFSETTRCKLLERGEARPRFGLLVREDGLVAPRCSGFRLKGLKMDRIAAVPGMQFGDRSMVLAWLRETMRYWTNGVLRPLGWLPVARAGDSAAAWEDVEAWFRRYWDSLGNGRVAALLTEAAEESLGARMGSRVMELYDPTRDTWERWRLVHEWELTQDAVKGWPEGWPKPWEEADGRVAE